MRIMRCGYIDDIHAGSAHTSSKLANTFCTPYFSAKASAFSCVRFTTPYSFCPLFSIACASSFAMTPQPALTQFAILFSAFLSTRLILIHLYIRFIDDLTDIHTTAFCPAHSTGERHLALTVFLLQCSTDRLYH